MTEKSPFNKSGNSGGGFDFYDFKTALAKQYGVQNAEFFAAAWRELSDVCFEIASRYSKLVAWCDKEIRQAGGIINAFSPADKTADYTTEQAKLWREQVHYVAELVYFRGLLLDHRTTNKQRENIEYTICKLYGIHYSEHLEDYV